MSQTLVVEAISDKFKNKYNNGSVLAGGKWLQVSSKVPLSLFEKDREITVETTTNAKGYTSIVGVVEDGEVATEEAQEAPAAPKAVQAVAKKAPEAKKSGPTDKPSYEDTKSRRILVQGIVQAVAQSPATINFGDNPLEINKKIKEMAVDLINFVDNQTL